MRVSIHRMQLFSCVLLSLITIHSSESAEFLTLGNLGQGHSGAIPGHINGELNGPAAWSISHDGSVVAGVAPGPLWPERVGVFRWTQDTGMVALSDSDSALVDLPLVLSIDGATINWNGIAIDESRLDAWVWSEDHPVTAVEFGTLPLARTAISADNAIFTNNRYFSPRSTLSRWSHDEGFEDLAVLPDTIWSWAVSSDGTTVAGSFEGAPGERLPFLWTAEEGVTNLPTTAGHGLYQVDAASTDGSVFAGRSRFAGSFTNNPAGLWRWSEASGMVLLQEGELGMDFREVKVSADGSVIAGRRSDGNVFRWTEEGGMELLRPLPDLTDITMKDFSVDGSWIVGTGLTATSVEPWLWNQETGMLRITDILQDQGLGSSIEGWQSLIDLRFPLQLSADASAVMGTGINGDGIMEAWVAYLDPIVVQLGLAGDYNHNGIVEQADLDLVLLNWGSDVVPDTWLNDLPTGAIDQEELDKILLGWGNTADDLLPSSPVPEPTAGLICLISLCCVALVNVQRKRRIGSRTLLACAAAFLANELEVASTHAQEYELIHTFTPPDNETQNWKFGGSVAVLGDHVLIGGGCIREDDIIHQVFLYDAPSGELLHTFDDPSFVPGEEGDCFGNVLDVSEGMVLIGTHDPGRAYLYDLSTYALRHQFDSAMVSGTFGFGNSVSLDENRVLIADLITESVHLFDSETGGLVHTFAAATGNPDTIAIDGDYVVIADDYTQGFGRALVFDASSGDLLHTLESPNPLSDVHFGVSVDVDADLVLVGDPRAQRFGVATGQAHLFDASTGELLQSFDAPDLRTTRGLGGSVALDGNLALIGSSSDEAHLFDIASGELIQSFFEPMPADDGRFGKAVAIDAGRVLIGSTVNAFSSEVDGKAFLYEPVNEPLLTGDYNNDGTVEQRDLDLVLLNWGSDQVPDSWLADLPSGMIDQQELDKVLLGWGNTSAAPTNAAAAPEPASVLILMVVLSTLLAIRERRIRTGCTRFTRY